MKKLSNKDISNLTNKSVQTIAGWATKQPKLLEVVRLGSFCKVNNITLEFLETCTRIQEIAALVEDKENH